MDRRKPVVKEHPGAGGGNHSPSPEAPSEDARKLSFMRSSRATSEARSDMEEPAAPRGGGTVYDSVSRQSSTVRASVARDDGDDSLYGSPMTPSRLTDEQMAAYRSSRAGSEVPDRSGGGYGNPNSPSPGKRIAAAAAQMQCNSQRSSRAGSEAPDRGGVGGMAMDLSVAMDPQRSSRADSEAPQRHQDATLGLESARFSLSASVVNVDAAAAATSGDAAGAGAPATSSSTTNTNTATAVGTTTTTTTASSSKKVRQAKHSKTSGTAAGGPGTDAHQASAQQGSGSFHFSSSSSVARQALRHYGSPTMPAEHIHDVERYIYHTVKRSSGAFQYYQLLHYPLETPSSSHASPEGPADLNNPDLQAIEELSIDTPAAGGGGVRVGNAGRAISGSRDSSSLGSFGTGSSKESSPLPRGLSNSEDNSSNSASSGAGAGSGSEPHQQQQLMPPSKEDSDSPSPHFDEAAFNAAYEAQEFLNQSGANLEESFTLPLHIEEPAQQSVSVLAMTMLPDPVSGAPVLGLCLGDYNGHVEYFEVSSSDSFNKKILKSKSLAHPGSGSSGGVLASTHKAKGSGSAAAARATESVGGSVRSETMNSITSDMRGREVARRHSHKAFVKSINALTSVAVEPCVKCLTFVRPHSSPSMISYLTANERVIKLFHVRREGFTPFSAFPYMEDVVGRSFLGSRYYARLPPQTSILPIKEYGPSANSIQALSVSADSETFLSVEDLQVFWWNFEAADTTKATCIADLRPPSGALDEVEELVTAASFHPTHSSLFMLSRSSGVLNIGDLRDPPSRGQRQYAITTQVTPLQNPTSCPAYDEILCSISAAAFLSPDHVITRDYLSLKLWDLRKPEMPYAMTPVMNYVARYLDPLYENDSIFDRFPVAVDDVSGTVVTGLYDGAVAVWQPLSNHLAPEDALVHYRVDPRVEPDFAERGGRATEKELEDSLVAAWHQHPSVAGHGRGVGGGAEGLNGGLDGVAGSSMDSGGLEAMGGDVGLEEIPEPFTNKVLNVAVAPGGERFGYTYKNGRLVYVFERKAGAKQAS